MNRIRTAALATMVACLGAGLTDAGDKAKNATTKAPPAKTVAKDTARKPASDPKAQAELLSMLDRLVTEKDPAKLTLAAKKLGNELLGALDYDRGLAKLTMQESLLEQARGDSVLAAQDAVKERKTLRARLEKDIADLKRLYKDDPKLTEQEIVARIQAFRPTLLALKHQEEEFTRAIRDTSEKLTRIRNAKQRLEREYDLVKLGVLKRKTVVIPPIGTPGFSDSFGAPRLPAPGPKESLQKALESIKDL